MRGPNWSSNVSCCLDLLRGRVRLFVGFLLGLDSCPHPRIASCRGVDFPVALSGGSASICNLRVFGIHPGLLTYIAAFIGIFAIAMVWWWNMVRHNNLP